MSDDELLEILRVSRRNNIERGITGLLLYRGGNFIQALEGPEDAIDELIDRIYEDPRHRGVQVLLREPKQQRYFPEWSMGFYNMDNLREEDRHNFISIFRSDDLPSTFLRNPQRAHKLLLSFKKMMR
jgi:hypothetical protein